LGISAFMVGSLALPPARSLNAGSLALAALAEAGIGLAFGFGFMVAYAATQIAGRALDIQMGFGAAGVLNPATQLHSPLIGTVFGMLAIVTFLAFDGHHVLLQALAASLLSAPPGSNELLRHPELIVQQSGVMFSFGLSMAAPVMFLLLLSDVAMAVFARSLPQLNVFVLGFVVKVALGLMGVALAVRFSGAVLHELFEKTFHYWEVLATDR
jgi:flagellar biosynthetic protein FliR